MSGFSRRCLNLKPSPIRELYDSAPEGAINLGLGELKFPLHPFIRNAGIAAIERGNITYTPNAGLPALRKKIAEHYDCRTENTCVTCGAEEAIFVALAAIVEPGDKVLVPDPGYLAYPNLVRYYGGTPLPYTFDPKDHFRLITASLESRQDVKAMILCNPSNPLGTVLSDSERDFILDFCKSNNIWLIVDEVYRELYHDERPESFAGSDPRSVVISGLSKSHAMTGWRLGWLSAGEDFVKAATRVHQYAATCAPRISQEVAIEALSEEGWKVNRNLREALDRNRRLVFERLSGWTMLENHAAPYLFIKVGGSDVEFAGAMLKKGVITVPGSAFGEMGNGWIRISYGLPEDELIEGLDRMRR